MVGKIERAGAVDHLVLNFGGKAAELVTHFHRRRCYFAALRFEVLKGLKPGETVVSGGTLFIDRAAQRD